MVGKGRLSVTGLAMGKVRFDLFLISSIKINSRWIKDRCVRSETVKELEENMGGIFKNICKWKKHF